MYQHVALWLAAFAFSLAIDAVYTKWTIAVMERRRLYASFLSSAYSIIGFCSLLICLDNYSAIMPSALGHALGTWLVVGNKLRREKRE